MTIEVTHTEFSSSTAENVWALWSDVATWSTWDHGIEWCKMNQGHKFQLNGEASLLPRGSLEPVVIRIIECSPNQSFTDEAVFDLGTLKALHEVVPSGNGVKIKHSLVFNPANPHTKEIFEEHMLPNLKKGLPISVNALARLAEEKCGNQCKMH